MQLINFIINTYFMHLRKYNEKGIEAALALLVIPFSFNFLVLLTLIMHFVKNKVVEVDIINFISSALIIISFCFIVNKQLEKMFLRENKFKDLFLPNAFYLVAPLHYIGSILLFIITLKYS